MPARAPEYWRRGGALAALLGPLSALYGAGGALRSRFAKPFRAAVPVICVGNVVAGGAGKTPVVISLARMLAARGLRAQCLTRGYGGSLKGPVRVDPQRHDAAEVGDEPLLLARVAPTWVARDRRAGALAAQTAGARAILMDDGLQNPALAKDLSLLAIDGAYGLGNGRIMPAGPLRESLKRSLARADAVVLVGADETGLLPRLLNKPVVQAELRPTAPEQVRGRRFFAFAGIGRPEKFLRSLVEAGAAIAGSRAFADHHRYRESELAALADAAERTGATLITTEKDWLRLPPPWRGRVETLPVEIVWRDDRALGALLERVFAAKPAHG
ncbi:MAG TPA: tetraacyldisaccharide 4'-kinase [Stellaceae bacterium]|nr:tetraacyldisaccharide 4'-kinase [Stellaceae bacterium]